MRGSGTCHTGYRSAVAALVLAIGLVSSDASGADSVYVYREPSGATLFSDRPQAGSGLRFLGKHGRPTATAACRGVTEADLRRRATPYRATIRRLAASHGVDPRLVHAVVAVESCFDVRARSRVGAQGLMQLMPATARELGVADPFDPLANLRGGITYLGRLLKRFHGDWELALAAYNAGPGAVERHNAIPPYPETRAYVRRVLNRYGPYPAD